MSTSFTARIIEEWSHPRTVRGSNNGPYVYQRRALLLCDRKFFILFSIFNKACLGVGALKVFGRKGDNYPTYGD
jgi:hypothetical protein